MKLRIISILTILLLIFSGCSINSLNKGNKSVSEINNNKSSNINLELRSNSENKEKFIPSNYLLSYEKYEVFDEASHTNVLIKYPQISGIESKEIENHVNNLLKEKAISIYKGDVIEGLDLKVEASVKLINTAVVSVKYSGYGKYHNTQSIFDVMYATNINIQEGEPIDLKKIFTDEFESKLSRDIFSYSGADKVKDSELIQENSHEFGYVEADEEIINAMFSDYYKSVGSASYYFNNSTITLIVPVPSVDSVFLELSASYDELLEVIILKNDIWNEIIK